MTHELSTTILISLFALSLGGCDMNAKTAIGDAKAAITDSKAESIKPSKVDGPGGTRPTCQPGGATTAPQDQLCPKGRVIGYFPNGKSCPSPYEGDPPKNKFWKVEPMFAGSAALGGSALGGVYCRYVWIEAGSAPGEGAADPSVLNGLSGKLGPDCRVFAQSPLASGLAPHYERAFAQGTEPIDPTVLGAGFPVRLEIVDTAPPQTSSGQASHGPSLAALAVKLASGCAGGPGATNCRRSVETQLGLPQTRTGADPVRGGYYGYQSELAEGIVKALDVVHGTDEKLVVNLSVGWEPEPGEFGNPTPAVQAVRDVIGVARCSGALVVAASGNRPQGTCLSQATSPGAWAGEPGLDAPACIGLGVANPQLGQAPYPFLHAATPLGWDRGNLADFRVGSNAALAAVGFAGFVGGNPGYEPMTGSSVSTVVVSAIATLVWSHYPDRKADEIMEALYDSGIATGKPVDLAPPQGLSNQIASRPKQRQVTACRALRHACAAWRGDPGAMLTSCGLAAFDVCADPAQPPVIDVAAWRQGFDAALNGAQVLSSAGPSWTALTCSGCANLPRYVKVPQGSGGEPAQPQWVVPQPHQAPCPMCKVKSGKAYLALDPTYDGMQLLSMSVQLYDAAGASEVLYYGGTSLPALSSTRVQELVDPELLSVEAGTATGGTATGGTASSTTGQPPVRAYVQMQFLDGTATVVAGNQIDVQ
jgi:hypothetical protein